MSIENPDLTNLYQSTDAWSDTNSSLLKTLYSPEEILQSFTFTPSDFAPFVMKCLGDFPHRHDLSHLYQANIIVAEHIFNETEHRTEFNGLLFAKNLYIQNPNKPMIILSFLPAEYIIEKGRRWRYLAWLLERKNVQFLQVPFYRDEDMKVLLEKGSNKAKNLDEKSFYHLIERKMSSFRHDFWWKVWGWERHDHTYDQYLEKILSQPELLEDPDIKSFLDEMIAFLEIQHPSMKTATFEYKVQAIIDILKYLEQQPLPEWSHFEWVFVDRDNCLYNNYTNTFNQNVLNLMKDYLAQGKKVHIWTWWNLENKQKLIDEAWLPYTIEHKLDYKGATVDIVIDNDDAEILLNNAKVKGNQHIKV